MSIYIITPQKMELHICSSRSGNFGVIGPVTVVVNPINMGPKSFILSSISSDAWGGYNDLTIASLCLRIPRYQGGYTRDGR